MRIKKSEIKYSFLFIATILIVLLSNSLTAANPEIELLRNRIKNEIISSSFNEKNAIKLLAKIKNDGTWPEINYTDVSREGFQHTEHLDNLIELCRAFKYNDSKLKRDKVVKQKIDLALNYWLANDFTCENWWNNQIGTPIAFNTVLYIMENDLSTEQIEKTLQIIGRAHLNASGARPSGDRIKIAGILAKSLLYKRDATNFEEIIKVIEGEIKFSTERGMQHDYSFHHRVDRVNNTLSYGLGYAEAFAEWAALVEDTKFRFSEKPLQQLTDYFLDGICKQMVYGKYSDTGAKNRDISRPRESGLAGSLLPERLLKASTYRKSELENIILLRKEQKVETVSHCTFFWQTEHFTFQRPNFFTSVRMYSTRNANMEYPYNSEGLTNHFRGDGTNYISVTGSEYTNLAPVNDWRKIPGTTILQKPGMPSPDEIQKYGLTDFVGAVTDGKYGAAVFDFKSPHDPVEARKSWFFFDNEYVCLGAGIKSGTNFNLATTINQCLLKGEVLASSNNQKTKLEPGSRKIENLKSIYHDGITYIFPTAQNVFLSNQAETGSWFSINKQYDSSKEIILKDVFKLWIDHGAQADDSKYQYIVVPATDINELEKNGDRGIEILANTKNLQAVKHSGLNITQIVFYASGELKISEKFTVGIDSPGVIMIKTEGDSIKEISVSDPSRKLKRIHLWINGEINKNNDVISSVWNSAKQVSEIAIDLPQNVFAGKSVSVVL